METFRRLINKSKLLTNNSNFTLQVSNIDGTELKPLVSDKNLLAHIDDVEDAEILAKLTFNSTGYASTFFSFDIGPGLPINYLPLGIKILEQSMDMTYNQNFTGPRSVIWNELLPTLNRESAYWIPTPYYKLLSELLERKIFLEFPAICEKSTRRIYGEIPTYGNLKGYLREKRVI
jgi:hypothetical protein